MIDKDTLLEMIKNQENTIKQAQEQLNKLYQLANESGLSVGNYIPSGNSIRSEIEQKRNELMAQADKMRQEALNQVQQAKSSVQNMASQMANIPNMPNMSQFEKEKING
jgi:ketol-acid reductoisomerase